MPKVAIIGGNNQYAKMFIERGWTVISDPFQADLIQFTGGADVSPFIYGELNTASHCDYHRDVKEAGIFAIAKRMGIKMAGICRGGQFLNVMCGGKMIQDIPNHATYGTHKIICEGLEDGYFEVQVTSTHHQGIVSGVLAEVFARAEDGVEEVVLYDKEQCLCFQPHPEFDGAHSTRDYYFQLLNDFFGF